MGRGALGIAPALALTLASCAGQPPAAVQSAAPVASASPFAAPAVTATVPPTTAVTSLPARCGAAGAGAFDVSSLPSRPPVPAPTDRGTVLTVTDASDDAAARLSFRAALEAANLSTGPVTIRFAPTLAGRTIVVGSRDLPPIDARDVTINGDIDGDGRPDVTLRASRQHSSTAFVNGLNVRAGGSRLHALALEGFSIAVHFTASRPGQAYAGDVVSGLVIRDAKHAGIQFTTQLSGANEVTPTDDRWSDISVIGNTISTASDGISFAGHRTARSTRERIVVAGNTIEVRYGGTGSGFGIAVSVGFWAGSERNRVSDVLIADNVIRGDPRVGIRISAGDVGASDNLIERVNVVRNQVDGTPLLASGNLSQGIALQVGDSSTAYQQRDVRPVGYPSRNELRDVTIAGNDLRGFGEMGISVDAGYSGAADNRIAKLRIEGNTLSGELRNVPGWQSGAITLFAGSTSLKLLEFEHSEGNAIVDATVSSNTIVLGDARTGSLPFATVGAIHLQGGRNAQRGSIREVTIAKNDISSTVPGVLLVGGNGEGALTSGNEIAATIECNVLRQRPKASFSRFVSEIRGITLVGGLLHPRAGAEARSNRVTAVARDNLIGGRIEEPLALPNANGSEGNEVSVTPGQRP